MPEEALMPQSLDVVTLGVPDVDAAKAFYSAVFSPIEMRQGDDAELDLHGTGRVRLAEIGTLASESGLSPDTSGFRGQVMTYAVEQPGEVEFLLEAAVKHGATVLKPAKKSLFAGVSAVFRSPDDSVWKLAAPRRKDSGTLRNPPQPTETVLILGVTSPKASRDFYVAMGMRVDRDYGDKFIDFAIVPGTCRLGLMTRQSLAKDAGVHAAGSGFGATVLSREAGSRQEIDALLEKAAASGGKVVVPAADTHEGGYAGLFADPDGFLWKVECAPTT